MPWVLVAGAAVLLVVGILWLARSRARGDVPPTIAATTTAPVEVPTPEAAPAAPVSPPMPAPADKPEPAPVTDVRQPATSAPVVQPPASEPATPLPADDVTAATERTDLIEAARTISTSNAVGDDFDEAQTRPFAVILVSAVAQTDVGRRRPGNEDSHVALDAYNVFAIADGMGGPAAGEVASAMAIDTLTTQFHSGSFAGEPVAERPRLGDELVRAVEAANARVWNESVADPEKTGMGTTLVAARFSPNKRRVYIANVGDSRCYRLRGTEFVQLTIDHTAALFGVTGRDAAKLTRSIGTHPTVAVDLIVDAPEPRDRYVLCSDGLNKMVPDMRIAELLQEVSDTTSACHALVAEANARGGRDNITVILVDVHPIAEAAGIASR